MKVVISRYGARGVLLRWPAIIDESILYKMTQLIQNVKEDDGIMDIHHAYHEVLIQYKKKIQNFQNLKENLQATLLKLKRTNKSTSTHWTIPVCYDDTLTPEVTDYLAHKGLDLDQLISVHTTPVYTVYFTGFLPGFLYLGGLDQTLTINRKSNPSRLIKKGTVAIGGSQTGIYPQNSPGGWYGIGYSPISFFDVNKEQPTWAKSGDKISFESVDKERIIETEGDISRGTYTMKSAPYES